MLTLSFVAIICMTAGHVCAYALYTERHKGHTCDSHVSCDKCVFSLEVLLWFSGSNGN